MPILTLNQQTHEQQLITRILSLEYQLHLIRSRCESKSKVSLCICLLPPPCETQKPRETMTRRL